MQAPDDGSSHSAEPGGRFDPLGVFDGRARCDREPRRHGEPCFDHLDRAAGEYWDALRSAFNAWLFELPHTAQADVRGRLTNRNDESFKPALWELYVHRLLRGLTDTVLVHPDLPASGNHPDFALQLAGSRVYVEATAMSPDLVEQGRSHREAQLYRILAKVDSPNWKLAIRVLQVGRADCPRSRQVIRDIRSWIGDLEKGNRQELELHYADWDLIGAPVEAGRFPASPFVVVGPADCYSVRPEPLVKKILGKAAHYGEIGGPFVIAVLVDDEHRSEESRLHAVFGPLTVRVDLATHIATPSGFDASGFFYDGRYQRYARRVSGLLMARALDYPWLADTDVRFYANPNADYPLPAGAIPVTSYAATGEEIARKQGEVLCHALAGIPADWTYEQRFADWSGAS